MSMVTVIVPANRRGMTTPERYREAVLSADADLEDQPLDAQIEILIGQATMRSETYCNRIFAREQVIETVYLQGEAVILLTRVPVVAIHSVTLDGMVQADTRWTMTDPTAGVLYLGYADASRSAFYQALGSGTYGWPSTPQHRVRVEVDYTGGWIMPGEADANFPMDLEGAAQLMVRELSERVSLSRLDVTSEKLGDASWSYGGGGSGGKDATPTGPFDTLIAPILDRYRLSPL